MGDMRKTVILLLTLTFPNLFNSTSQLLKSLSILAYKPPDIYVILNSKISSTFPHKYFKVPLDRLPRLPR